MSAPLVDVLTVGAGPSGLALALQATAHGARVRVVERRTAATRPSHALIVHPRTLEVLRPLGVTDGLLARGDVAPSVRLHLGGRQVGLDVGPFALADTAFPYVVFERQADVEAVLTEALGERGVVVERGSALVDLSPGGDSRIRATVRTAGGEEGIEARYVAGCDGTASTVRQLIGVRRDGRPYRQVAVMADLDLEGDLETDVAHVVVGRRGLLFLFALGEQAPWRLLATRHRDTVGGPGEPITDRLLQGLLEDAELPVRIVRVAWAERIPLERRLAERYRVGSAFLVGDAAHRHSPAGGLGMNTGILDATNLGWKLAFAAGAPPALAGAAGALLDTYEDERRPVARRVRRTTDALFWAEAGSGPIPSSLRLLAPAAAPLVAPLMRRRTLLAATVRELSQLRTQHRSSVLSVEAGTTRNTPRPGERLDDRPVRTAEGVLRLHELTAVPGVHVLLERNATALPEEVGGPLVHVHRVLSWPGCGVVTVRPDGYVGLRAAADTPSQTLDWLHRLAVA